MSKLHASEADLHEDAVPHDAGLNDDTWVESAFASRYSSQAVPKDTYALRCFPSYPAVYLDKPPTFEQADSGLSAWPVPQFCLACVDTSSTGTCHTGGVLAGACLPANASQSAERERNHCSPTRPSWGHLPGFWFHCNVGHATRELLPHPQQSCGGQDLCKLPEWHHQDSHDSCASRA